MRVGFDFGSARRIARVVERVERMHQNPGPTSARDTASGDGNFDDWVLTTSGTATGGWYPGKVQTYAEATNTWSDTDGSTVYIRGPNGETLTNATRYRGSIVDSHSGAPAYQMVGTAASAAAATITVKEVDNVPAVTGVTTLNFDQTDGFIVTDSGGGVARLDMMSAARTQAGIVDTAAQAWAGVKTFASTTIHESRIVFDPLIAGQQSNLPVIAFSNYLAANYASGIRFPLVEAGIVQMEVGVFDSAYSTTRSALRIYDVGGAICDLRGATFPEPKYAVNGFSGISGTQPVGQRCVVRGGLVIGFV